MNRREFLRKISIMLIGMYYPSWVDQEKELEYFHIMNQDWWDRNLDRKFPACDILNALSRKKNYYKLSEAIVDSAKAGMSRPLISEECDLNDTISECRDIIWSICDFNGQMPEICEMGSTETYDYNDRSYLDGYYKDGKIHIKKQREFTVMKFMHEMCHYIFDSKGLAKTYSLPINEGFASEVERIGESIYDKRHNTTHSLCKELNDAFLMNVLYKNISKNTGFSMNPSLDILKEVENHKKYFDFYGSSPIVSNHIGSSLFKILEKENGTKIYRNLMRGDVDSIIHFIY